MDKLSNARMDYISYPRVRYGDRDDRMERKLPDWLRLWFQGALIGEVYPQIRAIEVTYSEANELTVRYYLDREPTDFDFESLSMVVSLVLSNTSSSAEISSVREECVYSNLPKSKFVSIGSFVYARREYDMYDCESLTTS